MVDFEMSAALSQPERPVYHFAEEHAFGDGYTQRHVHFDQAGGAELDDDDE
jgi:hypothetical protein